MPLTDIDSTPNFQKYRFFDENGSGVVTACTLFPGLQAICNDLQTSRCAGTVDPDENMIEITFCMEGRYECSVSERYCFFVGPGNFSVGTVGRRESLGGFPTGRYRGVTFFLDLNAFSKECAGLIKELELRPDQIRVLATRKPRYFVLQYDPRLAGIREGLTRGYAEQDLPLLKLKALEMLSFLSAPERAAGSEEPTYLNRRQTALAVEVQKRIMADLARHITIKEMADELQAGTTALKLAFKSVYGISIYQYQKDYRLQEAQRLLRETAKPFGEIALMIGYNNAGKFTAAFKEKYGMTPTEYRRAMRKTNSK